MKRSVIIIVVWLSCQDLFGHTVKLQLYSSLVLETKVRTSIWPYKLMSKTSLKDTLINILRDVFLGKIEINSEHCLIKVNISSNITIDYVTSADCQKDNESSFNYYCFLFLPL